MFTELHLKCQYQESRSFKQYVFPNYLKGSRDPLLDVGSLFAKKGGIPMDK